MTVYTKNQANKIYIPQSLSMDKEYCPGTVSIYFIWDGQKTEKTIRDTVTWPGLTQDVEHVLLMFYQVFHMTKNTHKH
jgi:hypothetical protein